VLIERPDVAQVGLGFERDGDAELHLLDGSPCST
jgi:hypothetical protein